VLMLRCVESDATIEILASSDADTQGAASQCWREQIGVREARKNLMGRNESMLQVQLLLGPRGHRGGGG
jgi:hypothetical protein